LIAEYQAVRQMVLSQGEYRNNLLNFLIAIIGGMLAILGAILDHGWFFAFLVVSLLVSAMGLLYIFHARLHTYLIVYDHGTIRRQIEELIHRTAAQDSVEFRPTVLAWEQFYRDPTMKRFPADGVSNGLSFLLPGLTMPLASGALIGAFWMSRPRVPLEPYESALVFLAVTFLVILVAASIYAALSGAKLWRKMDGSDSPWSSSGDPEERGFSQ
jgi:hypothetical protein